MGTQGFGRSTTRRFRAKQIMGKPQGMVPSESALPDDMAELFPEEPERPTQQPVDEQPPAAPQKRGDKVAITRVGFLDGDDKTIAPPGTYQIVNLPTSSRFAKLADTNTDRLGNYPRIRVDLSGPGDHTVYVQLSCAPNNLSFTDEELKRLPPNRIDTKPRPYSTDGKDHIIIEDIAIGLGGMDQFKVKATLDGESVQSGSIRVWRMVFLVPMPMEGPPNLKAAKDLSFAIDSFQKEGIKCCVLQPEKIPLIRNIGRDEQSKEMGTEVISRLPQEHQPFVIGIAITDSLAAEATYMFKSEGFKGGQALDQIFQFKAPTTADRSKRPRNLWLGLDDQDWVEKAVFYYSDETGAPQEYDIPRSAIMPPASPNGRSQQTFSVQSSALPPYTGTVRIMVRYVDRFRGGISFGTTGVVCVATNANWAPRTKDQQEITIIHELGHHFGMAADGGPNGADRIPSHYDDAKGHKGSHCHFPLQAGLPRYDTDDAYQNAKCIMYGSGSPARSSFCPHCKDALKKRVLGMGWKPST